MHRRRVEEVHADDPARAARWRPRSRSPTARRCWSRGWCRAGRSRSSWAKIARLSSSCSGTASTTSSTSLRSSRSVVKADPVEDRRLLVLGQLAAARRPGRSSACRCPRPRSSDASSRSTPTTVEPAAGEHLDDPGAHRAEPDHADAAGPAEHAGRVDGGIVGHRLPAVALSGMGCPPGRCPVGGSVADCPRRPAAPATREAPHDPRPRPGGAGAVRVAGPGHRRGARHLAGRRRGLRPRGGGPGQGGRPVVGGPGLRRTARAAAGLEGRAGPPDPPARPAGPPRERQARRRRDPGDRC